MCSSALIWYDKDRFLLADPICTIVFSTIGFLFSLTVLRDILSILLLRTPDVVDVRAIKQSIMDIDSRVQEIHCFHVWHLGASSLAISCHISVSDPSLQSSSFLREVEAVCSDFGIVHSTIQTEFHVEHSIV